MAYTPETWAAIEAADRRRTHVFNMAVNVLAREADLGAAMSEYNRRMGPATIRWQQEMEDAVALSEDPVW